MSVARLPPNPSGQLPRVPIFVIRHSRWRRFTGATVPVRKSYATRNETQIERDSKRSGRCPAARCLLRPPLRRAKAAHHAVGDRDPPAPFLNRPLYDLKDVPHAKVDPHGQKNGTGLIFSDNSSLPRAN